MSNALKLSIMMIGVAAVLFSLVYLLIIRTESTEASQERRPTEQRLKLADLGEQCASSVGDDGYGIVELDRKTVIGNEKGEVPVPCKIVLQQGGGLTLNKVELRSETLVIIDEGENGKSRVKIHGSTLTGSDEAGVLIQLFDAKDSISVRQSNLKYPLGISVRATGKPGGEIDGGRIEVTKSSLVSINQASDGIELLAGIDTGVSRLVDVKLKTIQMDSSLNSDAKKILILAGNCKLKRVEGYNGVCNPEDALELEQR